MAASQDSFMFTVGKLDAGMAILLGERAHLIEFPSLLLPPGVTAGSIVNISVHQNLAEEKKRDNEFWALQNDIFEAFGKTSPEPPKLELRNVTQTSVTLEWSPLQLATSKLRSLDIYRNRQRLATIPSPLHNTSTKLSGLALDTEYTLQLVLRTTAGTFPSNVVQVKTHTMTNTSGISVCFGTVQDQVLLDNAKMALREMNAKWSDKIQIDTTHFVCTSPAVTPSGAQASGTTSTAPGVEYQRALQLSIPVVQPQWVLACHAEKKMVPIQQFYLGSPTSPINSGNYSRPQSMSQASLTTANAAPRSHSNHQSMPAQSSPTKASTFTNQPSSPPNESPPLETMREEDSETPVPPDENTEDRPPRIKSSAAKQNQSGRRREGTMDKNFKFPPAGNKIRTNTLRRLERPRSRNEISKER
jgi:hypothetical protein